MPKARFENSSMLTGAKSQTRMPFVNVKAERGEQLDHKERPSVGVPFRRTCSLVFISVVNSTYAADVC